MSRADARRAGVAGWPVEHSRSPMIHRHWLNELGLAGSYERFAVRPGEFPQFANRIGQDGLLGANVTMPHKEAAFRVCDRRMPVADALGAVNTLWRQDGLLWGDNTDVAGFLASMDESAPGWGRRARLAVVIGAGGGARAIVHALKSRGFERIAVVNRTQARAVALAADSGGPTEARSWADLEGELSQTDVLVNTSVLGMAGQPPLVVDLRPLPDRAVVADIVYIPLRTPLIESASARGLRVVEGLGMLLHQAAPAFARWFGQLPKVTPVLRALLEADVLAARVEAR
jgi:shikimate dehydrogenase